MELTLESLEDALMQMLSQDSIGLKPTKLIVPPALLKQAKRVLYYKKPIRRCSGMRKRKLNLYWRK